MKGFSNNKKYIAYLLTGSNLGNSLQYLQQAKTFIEKNCGKILSKSSYYKTAAWGFTEQPDFFNQVLMLETNLLPEKLMQELLNIEAEMGRKRIIKMGPRVIDIDILLIENFICNTTLLQVPHPQLCNRKFALVPLAEIAANVIHPVEKKSIAILLQQCSDNLDVQKK